MIDFSQKNDNIKDYDIAFNLEKSNKREIIFIINIYVITKYVFMEERWTSINY